MLLRFGVENHRSIRSYQEISLVASKLKDDESGLIELEMDGASDEASQSSRKSRLRVVPVLALYGANASGKSTVLNALEFFLNGIRRSHASGAPGERTAYAPFLLDEDSRNLPSRYDSDIALEGVRYHYGFTLDGKRILSEWLYSFPLTGARQTKTILFHRDFTQSTEFHFGKQLRGENKQIAKLVRENSLFLSAAAQNAHPQLVPIFEYFSAKFTRRLDQDQPTGMMVEELVAYFGSDKGRRDSALRFLKAADTGISGIDFSSVPRTEKTLVFIEDFEQLLSRHFKHDLGLAKQKEEAKVELLHSGLTKSYPIRIDLESAGTISLLRLLGPALTRLQEGGVLLIDELNSTLHPLVSRELIRLFSDPETNPGRAQLLFTTHDTNILSGKLLRRDQIWFAEKDAEGGTYIFAMSDIKVRSSENLEVGYLEGRYGAAPDFDPFEACLKQRQKVEG